MSDEEDWLTGPSCFDVFEDTADFRLPPLRLGLKTPASGDEFSDIGDVAELDTALDSDTRRRLTADSIQSGEAAEAESECIESPRKPFFYAQPAALSRAARSRDHRVALNAPECVPVTSMAASRTPLRATVDGQRKRVNNFSTDAVEAPAVDPPVPSKQVLEIKSSLDLWRARKHPRRCKMRPFVKQWTPPAPLSVPRPTASPPREIFNPVDTRKASTGRPPRDPNVPGNHIRSPSPQRPSRTLSPHSSTAYSPFTSSSPSPMSPHRYTLTLYEPPERNAAAESTEHIPIIRARGAAASKLNYRIRRLYRPPTSLRPAPINIPTDPEDLPFRRRVFAHPNRSYSPLREEGTGMDDGTEVWDRL